MEEGTKVETRKKTGDDRQKWIIYEGCLKQNKGGFIQNKASGLVLELDGDGVSVKVSTKIASNNAQKWILTKEGYLESSQTSLVLSRNSRIEGMCVRMEKKVENSPHQKWIKSGDCFKSETTAQERFIYTIHALSSCIIKLARIHPIKTLYRGIKGGALPDCFLKTDDFHAKGR